MGHSEHTVSRTSTRTAESSSNSLRRVQKNNMLFRIALAVVAAILLMSVRSGWWTLQTLEQSFQIGPRGVEFCRQGTERVCTWGQASRLAVGGMWPALATLTYVVASFSAAGLLVLAVIFASKKNSRWFGFAGKSIAALCLFTLINGVALAANAPVFEGMQHTVWLGLFFMATGAGTALLTLASARRQP